MYLLKKIDKYRINVYFPFSVLPCNPQFEYTYIGKYITIYIFFIYRLKIGGTQKKGERYKKNGYKRVFFAFPVL